MTTPELINKHERLLHAAKGRVQALKNQRWINANYKNLPEPPVTELVEVEAEITEHRRKLKSLYETI
jgi:hypothetical protein